jgi:hypothetical protein
MPVIKQLTITTVTSQQQLTGFCNVARYVTGKLNILESETVTASTSITRNVLVLFRSFQRWLFFKTKFWYLPSCLQPDGMLSFEWINVKNDWIRVASGLNLGIAIGIVLEVRRGECFIAYTPALDVFPKMPYAINSQGDIRLIADREVIWIKSASPSEYITVRGRIEYTFKSKIAA